MEKRRLHAKPTAHMKCLSAHRKKKQRYQRFNRHQPQENMPALPARETTSIWCDAQRKNSTGVQEQENIQPVPYDLKTVSRFLNAREKEFSRCPSAGKHSPGTKGEQHLGGAMHH